MRRFVTNMVDPRVKGMNKENPIQFGQPITSDQITWLKRGSNYGLQPEELVGLILGDPWAGTAGVGRMKRWDYVGIYKEEG